MTRITLALFALALSGLAHAGELTTSATKDGEPSSSFQVAEDGTWTIWFKTEAGGIEDGTEVDVIVTGGLNGKATRPTRVMALDSDVVLGKITIDRDKFGEGPE